MTDHDSDHGVEPSGDDERRTGERRVNADRRKHDSGPSGGIEKRKGERRKGDRRGAKAKPE